MNKYRHLAENLIFQNTGVSPSVRINQDTVTGFWNITATYKDDEGILHFKTATGESWEDATDFMISKIICYSEV